MVCRLTALLEMLFELATSEELFVAQRTLPGLYVVVLVHVVRPGVSSGEGLHADRADEAEVLHARVTLHVSHQIALIVKLAGTVIAVEVALTEMPRLVGFQVRFLRKGSTAEIAEVRLLLVVHRHVRLQSARLCESLVAQ